MAGKSKINLKDKQWYLNREFSLLQFNERVLALAEDKQTPLLERLRFLLICSANLDEFFEIRVAGLKQQLAYNNAPNDADGLPPSDVLMQLSQSVHAMEVRLHHLFQNELLPLLQRQHIYFLTESQLSNTEREWLQKYFTNDILPMLSPVALDMAHPFPRLANKSLNFIVSLEGEDAFGRGSGLAIVHAPRSLPRMIQIPNGDNTQYRFVLLTTVIQAHASELFSGMKVTGCYQFRLTRDSDLLLDDDNTDDLALALKQELIEKRFASAVRLEIAEDCPTDLSDFLLQKHGLSEDDLYPVSGPVNLARYMSLLDLIDRPELCYPDFVPSLPVNYKSDLFSLIQQRDILLYHPYQQFTMVVDFIRQATADPNVLAIKQTIYRIGPDSEMITALANAARAGKQVTVVVELRARFDEAQNIALANTLQEAGALVVYGVMGYKIHAKMTLVVRREGHKLRHYVHLGTGNYHEKTAKQYVDVGLLSYDQDIGQDVQRIFQHITGMGKAGKLRKLQYAPFGLHDFILDMIKFESKQAKKGKHAHIILKLNSLTEAKVIRALYKASNAGVKIDLIVRGICCLRPSVKGISHNIRVYSILGRFLEHSRIFYFHHGGDQKLFCASADFMARNFYKRVELCFPIEDQKLMKQLKQDALELLLSDNTHSWRLQADGAYKRLSPGRANSIYAQGLLLDKYKR